MDKDLRVCSNGVSHDTFTRFHEREGGTAGGGSLRRTPRAMPGPISRETTRLRYLASNALSLPSTHSTPARLNQRWCSCGHAGAQWAAPRVSGGVLSCRVTTRGSVKRTAKLSPQRRRR